MRSARTLLAILIEAWTCAACSRVAFDTPANENMTPTEAGADASDSTAPVAPVAPVAVIASGQRQPSSLLATQSHLYWTESLAEGAIHRCAITGCGTTSAFVPNETSPAPLALPRTLGLRDQRLYWANADSNTVMSVDLAGGGTTTTPPGQFNAAFQSLRWSGGNLYLGGTFVFQCTSINPLSCPGLVATSGQQRFAATNARVFWSTATELKTCTGACGAPDQTQTTEVTELETDGVTVVWTASRAGAVRAARVADFGSGPFPQPVELATDEGGPTHVWLDATFVYFTNNRTRELVRVSRSGGSRSRIAALPDASLALTGNADSIFVSTLAGEILRIRKPQ